VKSAVETLNPTRVKLTVEVPFDELEPSLKAAYKTIGEKVTVPGFRKGKVPPRIIDQRLGRGAVLQEAFNDALPKFYAEAAEENDLHPLGQPQVEVTGVPDPAEGGGLTFTVEVDVRPTIELPDYTSLEVRVDDIEVTDSDVDERLEQLRERFGTLAGVDRAAASGDFVSIDIHGEIDGKEIDTAKGLSYQVGAGTMLEGLDDALTGLSAGESTTFTTPLAGGDHAGEDAEVTVALQSVKERQLPDSDDDFAQLASEFDTLDELKADLRTQAEKAKAFDQGLQARDRVLDALLEVVDVPVPDSLVEEEVQRHLEAESRLEDDEHRAEVTQEAGKSLRTQLLLDAVVEKEEVQVNQNELIEYLVATAPRYGMDPKAFAEAVDQAGQVPAMVAEVARRKGLATVLESATVKDASGNTVDLAALAPRQGPDGMAGDVADASTADGTEAARDADDDTPAADDPTAVRL
jgi:trigger factor